MAKTTRQNPPATLLNTEMVGADITFLTLDYINNIAGFTGPESAQAAVLKTIQIFHTIIAIGPLGNVFTEQTFGIENPGLTVADQTALRDQIRALGTVDGFDLSGTTVVQVQLVVPL